MASLISPTTLKTFLTTTLADTALQSIIDAEEMEITQRFGAHTTQIDELENEIPGQDVFLKRKAASISEVVETVVTAMWMDDIETAATTLSADDYEIAADGVTVRRLMTGTNPRLRWGERVKVTYTPEAESAKRIMVLVDLCKLTLNYRGGLKSESVGGNEYSASFSDYQKEREAVLSTLAVNQRGIA